MSTVLNKHKLQACKNKTLLFLVDYNVTVIPGNFGSPNQND